MNSRNRLYAVLAVRAHIPPSEARTLPLALIEEILDVINTQ